MWRDENESATVTAPSMDSEQVKTWIGYGAAGLAALVFLLMARGQLKRSHTAWAQSQERSQTQAAAHTAAAAAVAEAGGGRDSLRSDLAQRIREDPAVAAAILRKWMHGDA
jgi:flagellar biosynthesis/type III secretory pathway M-ring protein FliF/YscJ